MGTLGREPFLLLDVHAEAASIRAPVRVGSEQDFSFLDRELGRYDPAQLSGAVGDGSRLRRDRVGNEEHRQHDKHSAHVDLRQGRYII